MNGSGKARGVQLRCTNIVRTHTINLPETKKNNVSQGRNIMGGDMIYDVQLEVKRKSTKYIVNLQQTTSG